ncbi:MAG: hypothetical protein U0136_08355 [Bdellovibrionota bacterium]
MLERIPRPAVIDLLQIFLLSSICLALGLKPLEDLDLGWHLAGGLWTIDHGSVPGTDFLSAAGSRWVAYSWLPEIIFAGCFRAFGFAGLVILQLVEIWSSTIVLYLSLVTLSDRCSKERPVETRLVCAVACLLLMQLLTPFWALRPQLLSAMAFSLLLVWAEKGLLTVPRAVVLTILWANVHVFWIAVPATAAIYRVFSEGGTTGARVVRALGTAFVLLLCGAISPYGLENLAVLQQYSTNHHDAYGLIREFQPMSVDLGYLVGAFFLATIVPFAAPTRMRGIRLPLLLLWLGCFVAALLQRKYLILFAPVSCAVYARSIVPHLAEKLRVSSNPAPLRTQLALGALLTIFVALALSALGPVSPMSPHVQGLLDTAEALAAEEPREQVNVLSSFDDGGWLGFGLYLNRGQGHETSAFRTSIDGRTLVMGGERLHNYSLLERGAPESCEILSRWRVTKLVLPKGFPLMDELLNRESGNNPRFPCLTKFEIQGFRGAEGAAIYVATLKSELS